MADKADAKLFTTKYFNEAYALQTLPFCGFGTSFIKAEEPDLQDTANSIGIEVVQVLSKSVGQFRAIWNKYAGTGLTSNQFAEKLTVPELKALVIPNLPSMAAIIGDGDVKTLIVDTVGTIDSKAQKFKHYTKFKRNGMYLFHNLLFPVQIEDVKKAILERDFPFDFYIMNLQGEMFVIDIQNDTVSAYNISPEQRDSLTNVALEYARSQIKKSDKR